MDKPDGQFGTPPRPESAATRKRLLVAAAELIAESGWGGVTTRAVAARAGLPHGAVSYHFHGKQELLTEAAVRLFERAFPVGELRASTHTIDLVEVTSAWLGEGRGAGAVVARVGIEAMLEQERNPALRERLTALLSEYRTALADVVRANQQRGNLIAAIDPDALATLLMALGDGLFLHGRLDPSVDTRSALRALMALLAP